MRITTRNIYDILAYIVGDKIPYDAVSNFMYTSIACREKSIMYRDELTIAELMEKELNKEDVESFIRWLENDTKQVVKAVDRFTKELNKLIKDR